MNGKDMNTNAVSLVLLLTLFFVAAGLSSQPATAPVQDPGYEPGPAPPGEPAPPEEPGPEPPPGLDPTPPPAPQPGPWPGQEPEPGDPSPPLPQPPPPSQGYQVTPEERLLLARLIRAEAEGEPFNGQVAVGAVVFNRIESPDYPDTVTEVIFHVDNGYVQFTPVANGTINLPPTQASLNAADLAIAGEDPSLGAFGFYNPWKSYDPWVRSRPVTAVIGNHVFFK